MTNKKTMYTSTNKKGTLSTKPVPKSVYNKMMEGYVPPERTEKSDIGMTKFGTVTEITIGDQKLMVHDPYQIEQIIKYSEQIEDSMFNMRHAIKQLNRLVTQHEQTISTLKGEVQRMKEILGGNNPGL